MKGMGPAVIGILAVSLIRLAPTAVPDVFAIVIFAATLVALVGAHHAPLQDETTSDDVRDGPRVAPQEARNVRLEPPHRGRSFAQADFGGIQGRR
jgi:hypothetical protein